MHAHERPGQVADLITRARRDRSIARVFVPHTAGKLMALIHARCTVLASEPNERGLRLTVEAEPHIIRQIKREVAS